MLHIVILNCFVLQIVLILISQSFVLFDTFKEYCFFSHSNSKTVASAGISFYAKGLGMLRKEKKTDRSRDVMVFC